MHAAVIACTLALAPPDPPVVERVEINHCYNPETGERRFVQVLYWDYVDSSGLHVVDWHMHDQALAIFDVPGRLAPVTVIRERNYIAGAGVAVEKIRAKRLVVTHTLSDPEEDDRAVFPVELRGKGLGIRD